MAKDQPPTITWPGASTWTAAQLHSKISRIRPRDRAAELLESFLYDKPRTSEEIWTWARQTGLGERVMKAAKKELRISSMLVYHAHKRYWYWLLPHHNPPGADEDP